jgi:hypothetical protein
LRRTGEVLPTEDRGLRTEDSRSMSIDAASEHGGTLRRTGEGPPD